MFVFGRLHFDVEGEKFWTIVCSYREKDGIDKLFEEIHFYLEDMMELYNKIYYNKPIFTGNFTHNDKKYYATDKPSAFKTEINVVIDGQVRPYSILLGLTTSVKKDGLSMDFGWLDEGFATPFEEFDRSIDPFRTGTGANLVVSGISSVDSANMQYYVHHKDDAIKTKLTFPVAYNLMKITHPSRAKKTRNFVESKITAMGIDSTNIQTNYFLNWETLDGKFYTKDLMIKNKNFGRLTNQIDGIAKYRVAGLDLSTKHDYTVLTIIDVYEQMDRVFNKNKNDLDVVTRWRYELRAIETYNIDRKKMSSEEVAERTAKFCNFYQIDMLMCDGTATQETYIEWILNKIKSININTLVVDYAFSGHANKVLMMSSLEDFLFSQRITLGSIPQLKEDWSWRKLYEEMLYLVREEKAGRNNVQWGAPEGKAYTDDHVMSLALAAYCIPYIQKLIVGNKWIEIGKMRFKAKFNKFNETKKERQKEQNYYLIV